MLERGACFEQWEQLFTDLLYDGPLSVVGEGLLRLELPVNEDVPLRIRKWELLVSNTARTGASLVDHLTKHLLEPCTALNLRRC